MTEQISLDEVLETLRGNHLFYGLTDQELVDVVHEVEVYQVDRGVTICKEGEESAALYIVQSGRACQTRQTKGKEVFIKQLTYGNGWGEDCLRDRARVRYRVAAISSVLLIRIDRAILLELAGEIPALADNLQVGGRSRQLEDRADLQWLRDGEEIIYMCRRHPLFLIQKVILPILVFTVLLFATAAVADLTGGDPLVIWMVGLLLMFFDGLWAAWNAYDWSNDYSIVTTLRVIYLERVFGMYDTRQETPLSNLQSINVTSSQMGRLFGYGNVIVSTYTGPLTLPDVEDPDEVANLIREHWDASRSRQRQSEMVNIEQTLRTRLSQTGAATTQSAGIQMAAVPQGQSQTIEPGFMQDWIADLFKVRIEDSGVITYRKHWFVLLQTTWKPILVCLVMLAIWFIRLDDGFTFLSTSAVLGFCAFVVLGMMGWMLYAYLDWRNDRYQITADQIIDLDKTPLGKEEKKIAQIENILSIEYKRIGIFGLLLNFGTVTVAVGTTQFTFDQVYDPSQVQQDLFKRMAERDFRKRQQEVQAEHERVSDWIATYHNHQEEFRTNSGTNRLSSQPGGIG